MILKRRVAWFCISNKEVGNLDPSGTLNETDYVTPSSQNIFETSVPELSETSKTRGEKSWNSTDILPQSDRRNVYCPVYLLSLRVDCQSYSTVCTLTPTTHCRSGVTRRSGRPLYGSTQV